MSSTLLIAYCNASTTTKYSSSYPSGTGYCDSIKVSISYDQNTSANTTTFYWSLTGWKQSGSTSTSYTSSGSQPSNFYYNANGAGNVVINSNSGSSSRTITNQKTFASGSFTVSHNSAGALSIYFYFEFKWSGYKNSALTNPIGYSSWSGTYSIPAIQRATVYDGSSWQGGTPRVYDGSSWITGTMYVYNGSAWKP